MTSPPRALITRPRHDAAPLAAALRRRGVACLIEPMVRIVPVAAPSIDLDGVRGLLITSANGVRAFAAACTRRDLPVYAVGEASAAVASGLGFPQVESAAGDVTALADLVAARVEPGAGVLFHPAGDVTAGDLAGRLGALGYALRRSMLYEAKPAEEFSPTLRAALQGRGACKPPAPAAGLRWVLFFSPRTTATFVSLSRAAGLADACRGLSALCLSGNVAEAAARNHWRAIEVAARPEQAAMLALLDRDLEAAPVSRAPGMSRRS